MRRIEQVLIVVAAAAFVGGFLMASSASAADSPWHNPAASLDVDGNRLVQPRDVLLVINQLQQPPTAYTALAPTPSVDLNDVFYWDTSDDGRISPLDALLVINHLISHPTPEPSTLLLGGMAGAGLAAFSWRRKRRKA